MGGRNQNRLLRHLRQTCHRQIVEIGDENKHIIVILVLPDVLDAGRRIRPLLFEPDPFLGTAALSGGRLLQILLVIAVKVPGAQLFHREPAHGDTVNGLHVSCVPILPGGIIHRLGGQDFHFIPIRQPFCDHTGIILRAAVHFQAIALVYQSNSLHVLTPPSAFERMSYIFPQ